MTHRSCDTRTLLHPTPVKSQFYLGFCTSSLVSCERPHLHTDPLTHKRLHFYTHTLLHPTPVKSQFYLGFCTSSLVSCERPHLHTDPLTHKRLHSYTHTLLHPTPVKSQFYLGFCTSSLVSCERVAPAQVKSQFYLSILRIDPHFVRDKSGTSKIAILPQFLTIDHHFVRKGCSRTSPAQVKSQF